MLVYQDLVTLIGIANIFLLRESLGPNNLLGGPVILLGVYLAWHQQVFLDVAKLYRQTPVGSLEIGRNAKSRCKMHADL